MNRRIAREGRGWRMPREDRTWLIVVLEPLFWLFVHFLYPLLFGWWADKALARKHQRRLARDIRKALPFLFERYTNMTGSAE